MKADDASGNQTEVSTMEGHRSQNNRKRKISGSSYDPGMAELKGRGELFGFTVVLFYDTPFYCLNFYLSSVKTDFKDGRE